MSVAFVTAGHRTPLGRFLGGLTSCSAPQLASMAIKQTLATSGFPSHVLDQTIVGCVVSAGLGQAPARQASLGAGIPEQVGATTVNKVCGSGLMAVMMADQAIRAGDATAIIAAGMESMTNGPHLIQGRSGWKYGPQTLQDSVAWDGLQCSIGKVSMGIYAEKVAMENKISREDQDRWAVQSHQRALAAAASGKFKNEIVPVEVIVGKNKLKLEADEGPRSDCSLESLAKLRPAFSDTGTVTAGNASPLSDGAASVLVVGDGYLKQAQGQPIFRIVSHCNHAALPADLFTAPIQAIQKTLSKAGKSVSDVDLFEINEAFASQVLACAKTLEIEPSKLNIHGGAIALGHPLGCSGTRVLVTLMHAMVDRMAKTGVAALCLGGGESVAMLIERV